MSWICWKSRAFCRSALARRRPTVELLEERWLCSAAAMPVTHAAPLVVQTGAQTVAAMSIRADHAAADVPPLHDHADIDPTPILGAPAPNDHDVDVGGRGTALALVFTTLQHEGNAASLAIGAAVAPMAQFFAVAAPALTPGSDAAVARCATARSAGAGAAPAERGAPADSGVQATAATENADAASAVSINQEAASTAPQSAGLLANLLPVEPAALAAGLRQFLEQLDGAPIRWLDDTLPAGLTPWACAVGLAVAGGTLARWRHQSLTAPALAADADERRPSGIRHQWTTPP